MNVLFEPRLSLSLAGALLLAGFILPLLMVVQVIESSFFLNFFTYAAITLGNILGFLGLATLTCQRKRV